MLIKGGHEDKTYAVCGRCGKEVRLDKNGGHCNCGNIRVNPQRDGTSMVIADDSDQVIYDNDK